MTGIATTTILIAIATPSPNAYGADVDCPTASEEGQRLRDKGRYVAARDLFRMCARSSCPAVVSRDCTKWLAEIEDGMPSIVVAARDVGTGADIASVRVLVDGEPVTSRLDGKPVSVDPGEHAMRFEAEGYSPSTQQVIVRVGERNRLVRVELRPLQAVATQPEVTPTVPPNQDKPDPGAPKKAGGPPILSYILGGVGIVAIGGGSVLGFTAKSELSDLRSTCAPFCDASELDSVKTRLLIADVALGAGIVALGVAAVLFLTHSSSSSSAPPKTARHTP